MKLSTETKESISTALLFIGLWLMVVIIVGLFFGFYWMIGNFVLKALGIIFNRN